MIEYLTSVFSRMVDNKALTPQERAFLKALFGFFVGLISAAAPQLPDVLAGRAQFNVISVLLIAVIVSVLLAVSKLWASTKDPAVGKLLDYYADELSQIDQGLITVHQLPKLNDISTQQTVQTPAITPQMVQFPGLSASDVELVKKAVQEVISSQPPIQPVSQPLPPPAKPVIDPKIYPGITFPSPGTIPYPYNPIWVSNPATPNTAYTVPSQGAPVSYTMPVTPQQEPPKQP